MFLILMVRGKARFVKPFFGETTKELTGDDVIRRGFKNCEVELILNDADLTISINRSRKRGLIVKLIGSSVETNITEGKKQIECQEILKSLLGFDKNVFLASCYFSQESLSLFTRLSDVDRTNMITHLLGFETYDNLYEKVKNKIENELLNKNNLNLEVEKLKRKIELLNNDRNSVLNRLIEINNDISKIENRIVIYSNEVNDYTDKIDELNNSIRIEIDISDLEQLINSNILDLDRLNSELDKLNSERNILNEKLYEHKNFRMRISTIIESLGNRLNEIMQQINEFRNFKIGSRCDKCGAIISSDNMEKFIDEKTQNLTKFQCEIDSNQQKLDELNKQIGGVSSEIRKIDEVIGSNKIIIKSTNETVKTLNSQKYVMLEQKNSLDKNILELNTLLSAKKISISDCKSELSKLNKQFSQFDEQKNSIESNIEILNSDINACKASNLNIDNEIEILMFWKESFSSKGIRSLLLDKFCNEFNVIINEYLSIVSNGLMNVIINPIKILKSGEERNRIDFDISLDSTVVKYNSLSGGEKRRVDISMCLALNKWVSNKFGIQTGLLGILILDEIFSYIDRLGEETIATLLFNESRNRTIFVISHTPELISYVDKEMVIIKENGVSRLEQIAEKMQT